MSYRRSSDPPLLSTMPVDPTIQAATRRPSSWSEDNSDYYSAIDSYKDRERRRRSSVHAWRKKRHEEVHDEEDADEKLIIICVLIFCVLFFIMLLGLCVF